MVESVSTTQAMAPAALQALSNHGLHRVAPKRFLGRLRYQLLLGVLVTVLLPPLLYFRSHIELAWQQPQGVNSVVGAFVAFLIAIYLFRRAIALPGIGAIGHVLPAAASGYGLLLTVYFSARLEYSVAIFGMSFTAAITFLFLISMYLRSRRDQRFFVVPSAEAFSLPRIPNIEWVMLKEPRAPADGSAVLIADLRASLGDEWERLIADMAVAGHPVYHIKQVRESLTGQVQIEHLSENNFGSLIPNHSYRKLKRIVDLLSSLLLFPMLLVPALVVAVAIRMDSPGPIFFRQRRRGYRGEVFEVVKFRTMTHLPAWATGDDRSLAITQSGDDRITRVGRFLRRTRIDELPQIWNIIKGEMTWIGPRPEALPLSEWYEAELPFYTYRHIVRPGITGWAQVNQGHVAELERVHEKLQYDFFYIKNFSVWLDLLIVMRTMTTVLSGHGAK